MTAQRLKIKTGPTAISDTFLNIHVSAKRHGTSRWLSPSRYINVEWEKTMKFEGT